MTLGQSLWRAVMPALLVAALWFLIDTIKVHFIGGSVSDPFSTFFAAWTGAAVAFQLRAA